MKIGQRWQFHSYSTRAFDEFARRIKRLESAALERMSALRGVFGESGPARG